MPSFQLLSVTMIVCLRSVYQILTANTLLGNMDYNSNDRLQVFTLPSHPFRTCLAMWKVFTRETRPRLKIICLDQFQLTTLMLFPSLRILAHTTNVHHTLITP